MSDISIDPNDPRLTDYVLGELDPAERAEIEQLLERSPAARAAVDDLLELSGLLAGSLKSAPGPALTADQRAAIDAAIQNAPKSTAAPTPKRRSLVRTAATLATIAVSAAAMLMVVFVLNRSHNLGDQRNASHFTESAEGVPASGFVVSNDSRSISTPGAISDFTYMTTTLGTDRVATGGDAKSQQGSEGVTRGWITNGRVPKDALMTDSEAAGSLGVPNFPDQKKWSPLPAPPQGGPAGNATPQQQSSATVRGMAPTPLYSPPPAAGETPQIPSNFLVLPTLESWPKHGTVVGMSAPEQWKPDAQTATLAPGGLRNTPEAEVAYSKARLAQSIANNEPSKAAESKGRQTNAEAYDAIVENPFFTSTGAPLSTFSIDVDTASYSNMRRFFASGQMPPRDSVRIEELVNYFDYEDPAPTDGRPFAVRLEAAGCPWAADHRLVRISLKGKEIPKSERPPTNLVFLLDVSGSMRDANKLPLVREAMKLLVSEMTEDDRIAIVTYAGNAGLVLDSTTGDKKDVIVKAIDNLQAGGSTNGEAGIQLAYSTAVAHLFPEGSNRVILCTDGDFNVGVSGDDELVQIIQDKARDSKVFLSVFGFGMGNLKDAKLEKLADKGNGHYAYVDNLREAKKVFVEDMTGTLYTIAKDVKLQLEFNPAKVGAYRLIGYENRVMPAEHFNDDTKDAGEIGAGHTVTALYELIPADKMTAAAKQPGLKYQEQPQPKDEPKPNLKASDELLTVSLRYKHPDGNKSDKLEFPLVDKPGEASQGSRDMQWTTAVAAFGMLLRGSQYCGQSSFDMVLELAQASRGDDKSGRRAEFIELAKTAKTLYTPQAPVPPSAQPVEPKPPQ